MKRLINNIIGTLFSLFLAVSPQLSWAQCAMCKAAAGTTDEAGGLVYSQGMNTGVLYLLGLPFIGIAVIAFVWLRRRKQLALEVDNEAVQAQ